MRTGCEGWVRGENGIGVLSRYIIFKRGFLLLAIKYLHSYLCLGNATLL